MLNFLIVDIDPKPGILPDAIASNLDRILVVAKTPIRLEVWVPKYEGTERENSFWATPEGHAVFGGMESEFPFQLIEGFLTPKASRDARMAELQLLMAEARNHKDVG